MVAEKLLIILAVLLYPCAMAQISVQKLADLPEKMRETSGLVLLNDKYLITHNDGGNKSELFLVDLRNGSHKTIEVKDVKNVDWEELTLDEDGNLYIGDFGNNLNKRESCQIYKIKSGFEEKEEVEAKKISFTYQDQAHFPPSEDQLNFDCEAMIWKDDSLYLFTKCRTEPFSGITNIYVLSTEPGKHVARKIGSIQLCSSDWRFCSVTGASYSPKQNLLVLLTYSRLYLINDFPSSDFWKGKVKSVQLNFVRQREAICFKGKNAWYMTDEYRKGMGGGNLYEVKLK